MIQLGWFLPFNFIINPVEAISESNGPIQDRSCWGRSRMMGGAESAKRPSLKSVTYILQWWNFAVIPYLKKIQKMYKSRNTPLHFCWHQHFFTRNQQVLLYREILLQIAILMQNLKFFFFFLRFLNKYGCNFDDVSKTGYSRSS